jgi:hypothetical protein
MRGEQGLLMRVTVGRFSKPEAAERLEKLQTVPDLIERYAVQPDQRADRP